VASNSCTKDKAGSRTSQVPKTNDGYFSSERVRVQTQLEKTDLIIKEGRLRWLGHVLRMDDNRLPRQAVHWDISGSKRKPARPQKNWIDTIQQNLKSIGMIWEVAQQLAVNRVGWHRRVAQCVFDTA